LDAITALAAKSNEWFGATFAAATQPTDDQSVAVAGFIEAAVPSRTFGVTSAAVGVPDSTITTDIASRLKALLYRKTFVQYSTSSPYAAASFFARNFSVDFNGNKTTITTMYKQEPGVVAESLTEGQAIALKTKRANVFVGYDNGSSIIQYGTMAGNAYFDEVHGLAWLQDAIQNSVYNLLYTSTTKIPQTDGGQNQIVNACVSVLDQSVINGLVAPGTWNADGFGQLVRGQYLEKGYYVYTQPMALQDQATREQRIAPPIQIAVKLAGAIQQVDIVINVNR
jgi:hypothetical protein